MALFRLRYGHTPDLEYLQWTGERVSDDVVVGKQGTLPIVLFTSHTWTSYRGVKQRATGSKERAVKEKVGIPYDISSPGGLNVGLAHGRLLVSIQVGLCLRGW